MFGITFTGNPWINLKLLLPDNWPADLPPPLLKSSKPERYESDCIWRLNGKMSDESKRREESGGLMEYSVENLVPFGPIHPALKEPEYFKLILEGEKIVQVIPRIGYVHRGLEKAAEQRPWVQNMYMFERTCGICSFVHSLCYGQAVEELTVFQVPRRAKFIRLIIVELERIHSHLLWVGLMGHWAGFETLFMWVWDDSANSYWT